MILFNLKFEYKNYKELQNRFRSVIDLFHKVAGSNQSVDICLNDMSSPYYKLARANQCVITIWQNRYSDVFMVMYEHDREDVEKMEDLCDAALEAIYKELSKMSSVSESILYENKWENADHKHTQESQIKPLQHALEEKGYKCTLFSKSFREAAHINCEMSVKRGNEKSYVKLIRKKTTSKTGQLMVQIADYGRGERNFDWITDDKVNEICIIVPPEMNNDPHGVIVDNTKACFFDKAAILNAFENQLLISKKTQTGEFIAIPDRWAKANAKEVISYKNIK